MVKKYLTNEVRKFHKSLQITLRALAESKAALYLCQCQANANGMAVISECSAHKKHMFSTATHRRIMRGKSPFSIIKTKPL